MLNYTRLFLGLRVLLTLLSSSLFRRLVDVCTRHARVVGHPTRGRDNAAPWRQNEPGSLAEPVR